MQVLIRIKALRMISIAHREREEDNFQKLNP